MQILTRLNKVIAHSEYGYTPVGNSAICLATNLRYDDAVIVAVDCVPTDIDCCDYYYINGRYIKSADVVRVVEINHNTKLQFWVGTQAEYDVLTADKKKGIFAIITDDLSKAELLSIINSLQNTTGELKDWHDSVMVGSTPVPAASKALGDSEGNNIPNTYRKEAEKRVVVTASMLTADGKGTDIYWRSTDMRSVDLSTYFPKGKTTSNTVGIGGEATINFTYTSTNTGANTVELPIYFDGLWQNNSKMTGSLHIHGFWPKFVSSLWPYFRGELIIDGTKRVACKVEEFTNANTSNEITISAINSIKLKQINIYF